MMQWTCPKCRSRFPKPGDGTCPWRRVEMEPPFLVGDVLRHIPTGRPVRVAEITVECFTVDTIDDVWANPKDGKQKGGYRWLCLWPAEGEFKKEETQ